MASAYHAATTGRRLADWMPSSGGPNSAIWGSLETLRTRARDSVRNDGYAGVIVDTWAANLVGTGIIPRWQLPLGFEDLKEELQLLWADSMLELDADGQRDFYGFEADVVRSVAEAGECLVRFRQRRANDNFLVPLQLQMLEADHIDTSMNHALPNGGFVRLGVEFNSLGRRVAYHLRAAHPGDMMLGRSQDFEIRRVPARQVLHIFRPLRPGQVRGVTWLANVLLALHQFELYNDNEQLRHAAAAAIGGFIKPPTAGGVPMGKDEGTDSAGQRIIGLEPGTYVELPPGFEITNSHPAEVSGSYEAWVYRQAQQIATGAGITYEQLTGDLRGVNLSSIRAGLLDFRRRAEMLQRALVVHQLCRPVVSRWIEAAVLSGALELLPVELFMANRRMFNRIAWQTDPWEWVDPLKDMQAKALAVEKGFTSRSSVASGQGHDPEALDRERAAEQEREAALGITTGDSELINEPPEEDEIEQTAARYRDLPIVAENDAGDRLMLVEDQWVPVDRAA